MFLSIEKNYLPFDNPIFEYAGLDNSTLQDVLQRSKWGGGEQKRITSQDIAKKLDKTIRRVYIALRDGSERSFGVRQEYRIRVSTLRKIWEKRYVLPPHLYCHILSRN